MRKRFCVFCENELDIKNSKGYLLSVKENIQITFKGKTLEFGFTFSQIEESEFKIHLDTDLCLACWEKVFKKAIKENIPKLKIESV